MGAKDFGILSFMGRLWRGVLSALRAKASPAPADDQVPAGPEPVAAAALRPEPAAVEASRPEPEPLQPEPEPEAESPAEPEIEPGCGLAMSAPVPSPATSQEIEAPEEEVVVKKEPAKKRAVAARPDPEAAAFQLKAAELKGRIADLSARQAEMEQLVNDFRQAQYQALSEVLSQCLGLRVEYLRLKAADSGLAEDLEAARAAEAEYASYHQVRAEPESSLRSLGEEEQEELRALYRVAAMRCHPDRVADEDKASAHARFLKLQEAYRQGDRAGLHRILRQLAEANEEGGEVRAPGGKAEYRKIISDLGDEAGDRVLAIQTLQLSETYRQALEVEDWDEFFAPARARFEAECEILREHIQAYSSATACS